MKLHRSSQGSFITRICFIYGFLLVQLTCLVSEVFPPLFLGPGQGLSVVGSSGCGCQAAVTAWGHGAPLPSLGIDFCSAFLKVDVVSSERSQQQVIS